MTKQPVFTTDAIFPVIVIVLSLMNISASFNDMLSLSVLVSVVGITGAVLFFMRNPIAPKIIYAWIIVQIVSFPPAFDLSQGFNLVMSVGNNNSELHVNFIAIAMLGTARLLATASLAGRTATIYQFRESSLGNVFPVTATLIKRVVIEDEKNWLLAHLSTPVNYNEKPVHYVLIRRKDGETLKLGKEKQVSFLRLVVNETDLDDTNNAKRFPFIDWVYVAK
ncbi:hypothetical protein ACLI09_00370 [Flavobacterium sp. RHBU_24]|uniref:hypothetical protein n=1 Tax=Flavobacterium sp. RHBU_24 TaxID=3391185 RepID=UPI0039849502